jgi:hypothetical protein
MLEGTLARLRDRLTPKKSEAVLLVCVPTDPITFWANRKLPKNIRSAIGLHSDYAFQVSMRFNTHADYQRDVGEPFLTQLRLVSQLGAHVKLRVSFKCFERELDHRLNRVFFLIAHHAATGIEFHDGSRAWLLVRNAIADRIRNDSAAFVLTVCHSDEWQNELETIRQQSGELGGAGWEMPLLESATFARLLISQLDGNRTLLDAQDKAIRLFWRPNGE